jgi:hypothetical protein
VTTIDEKRVYSDRRGARTAYVASAIGLARVSISRAVVGEFGLLHRGEIRDVATGPETLVVATDDVVHVASGENVHTAERGGQILAKDGDETDFRGATAVGVDGDGRPLAASRDGRLARYTDGWKTLGTVPAAVRAFGQDAVACADGIRSLSSLDRPTLDDVRDVDDPGPVVATADGVYECGETGDDDGTDADESRWRRKRNGATDRVATAGDRLAAVADGTLLLKEGTNWERPLREEPIRDVVAAQRFYAVTDDGQMFIEDESGWRSRSIGLQDVHRLAVT